MFHLKYTFYFILFLKTKNCRLPYEIHIIGVTRHIRKELNKAGIKKTEMDEFNKRALSFWSESEAKVELEKILRKCVFCTNVHSKKIGRVRERVRLN